MPPPKDPAKYEEWKEKISKANKGRLKGIPKSKEHKQKIKESNIETWKNEALRKRRSNQVTERYKDPEKRKIQSEAVKKSYEDNPDLRKQRAQSNRRRRLNPEFKAAENARLRKQSKMIKKLGLTSTSEVRKKKSISVTAYYKNNPDAAKKSEETKEKLSKAISKLYLNGVYDGRENNYVTGWYDSCKAAGKIWYRSSYELKAYQILDADDFVMTYIPESVKVKYRDENDKIRYYIPDIQVIYYDQTYKIIEVKPQYMLGDENTMRKINAAKSKYGDRFVVWTEKELGIPL